MPGESAYRLSVLALLVVFLTLGARFRLRAARGGRVSRRGEGPIILFGLRTCALLFWAVVLTYLCDPSALRAVALGLPEWARPIGVPLALLAAAWMCWTLATLGLNLTDTVAVREAAYLVTTGPYRLVRHPFYIGVALMLASVTLLTDSAPAAALAIAVLAFLAARTPIEEQQLLARFGGDYRTYMARTGRFWPRAGLRTA